MGSRLNSDKKNNIGNHGEHSTKSDTTTVSKRKKKNSFKKEFFINLVAPSMKGFKKYARNPSETTEEHIFVWNPIHHKRRKIVHNKEELINNDFMDPFDPKYQVIIFTKEPDTFECKSESYNIKRFKTKLHKSTIKFSKFQPEIVLDFIKHPTASKLMKLLNIMYIESLSYHVYDLKSLEHSRIISSELKKYLHELCYQKFCELWMQDTPSITLLSIKHIKRVFKSIHRLMRCRASMPNVNLKKLLLHNGSLTGYPKKPLLILCINIMCKVFIAMSNGSFRKYRKTKKYKKNYNLNQSIKLYWPGTTKMKSFLEVVNEYKKLICTERLNFYQVADVIHAYESMLQPGQYIDKKDLEICANENYNFEINNYRSSNDLNATKNDDFDFEIDSDKSLQASLNPKITSYFTPGQFQKYKQKDVKSQFCSFFGLKFGEKTKETEVHIQSTSNEDHNIDMDISTNDLDGNNSPESALHLVLYNKPTLECVTEVQAINNQDIDIYTGGLEGTRATNYSGAQILNTLELGKATNTLVKKINSSKNYSNIIEILNNALSHQIKLSKSEKRMLTTIIFLGINPLKGMWRRLNSSGKTRLYQIIVYFRNFKMALCDKLHLNHLDFKSKNIFDMIDINKLLRSIQVESCVLQECVNFTEVENLLIWPLDKMIVNNFISQRSPTINILFSFVKNIITKFCEKVKDFCYNSRIVLNKESLFENLSNVRIEKVLNAELLNDAPGTSNSEHLCVTTNTEFCLKKNSSNEEICKSMVNILKSDDFIHKSWKESNNFNRFISKLLKAGVTLPIKESNTGHGSKFIEVYVKWFCEEYLQDDKFYKLAVSIFKNTFLYIDTVSGCTDIKVEDTINNALMILYDQPCFAKMYESYLNTKYPKCLSSLNNDSTNDTENHSDYKYINIKGIEELQIEPNVNVQTDPIDINNVGMSLVPTNIPTSDVFNILNNDTINNLVTPDPQPINYEIDSDFLLNLINESSNDLSENIEAIDNDDSMFNTHENDSMDIDDPSYNNIPCFNEFNEDCPFDDEIPTADISFDYHLSNNTLEPNLEFQQDKHMPDISLTSQFDQYFIDDELNLQFENKNTGEVSMISSDQLVNFDQNDEINLNELPERTDEQCGFYNAGVLFPPYY